MRSSAPSSLGCCWAPEDGLCSKCGGSEVGGRFYCGGRTWCFKSGYIHGQGMLVGKIPQQQKQRQLALSTVFCPAWGERFLGLSPGRGGSLALM